MTKKKKKNNKKKVLVNTSFVAVALIIFIGGFLIARYFAEKRIANYSSTFIYKAKETLKLVCNDIRFDDPKKDVAYFYNMTCYLSDAKSAFNSVNIQVNNNGVVRLVDYNIPAETSKSKEDNYTNIENIVKRTNEAIMASGLDVSRIDLTNGSIDLFKTEFENRTYEQKTFVGEIDKEQTKAVEYNPQKDETPYIPPYFNIQYRG